MCVSVYVWMCMYVFVCFNCAAIYALLSTMIKLTGDTISLPDISYAALLYLRY